MHRNPSARVRVPRRRTALLAVLALTVVSLFTARPTTLQATPTASSHWYYCNNYGVGDATSYFWNSLHNAAGETNVPDTFWSYTSYRDDMAKIVCYESSFNIHANNGLGYYGWFQMSKSLIGAEGISFSAYWYGTSSHTAGWYQCVAGGRYIASRYGNPANAWAHERDYGWY